MKKIFSSIFILTIIASLFAPFSVNLRQNGVIEKNVAEALSPKIIEFKVEKTSNTEDSIAIAAYLEINDFPPSVVAWEIDIIVTLTDPTGKEIKKVGANDIFTVNKVDSGGLKTGAGHPYFQQTYYSFENLTKATEYTLTYSAYYTVKGILGSADETDTKAPVSIKVNTLDVANIGKSLDENSTTILDTNASAKDKQPVCGILPGLDGTFVGCLLQGFYYLVFEPTSWLFKQAGLFFDRTFAYSIADSSYRTGFVVGGWGIVRDICNVFFIFVLLYVAFSTILNIHGFKTKEMIINVVLIGVLINFSLFTTQVIIDTSNILARVFYNSESIKQNKNTNTTNGTEKSPQNEISLSEGLVSIIDPQKILAQEKTVTTKATGADADNTTWFITILMASILNVVGFITFLIVGLLFIARVIGLWVAMVVVPFAFFSYTVPAMQGMDTLGWKKWWPETLKMAFMAPIFMFFIYLLLRFVEKGFNMVADSQGTGATGSGMLAVIIPFLFIMIFLIKAKDMAKSFSGSIGEAVTKAGMAIGGLALGGAALSTAMIGRQTMGRIAKAATNDTAAQKAYKERGTNPNAWNNLSSWQKFKGRYGSKITGHEKSVDEKNHSEHVLNEKAQAVTGRKDATYKDLSAEGKQGVKDALDRDLASKEKFGKIYDRLNATERADLEVTKQANGNTWAGTANAMAQAAAANNRTLHTADHMEHSTKYGTGLVGGVKSGLGQLAVQSRTGSYDIRNLSQMKALQSSWISKLSVGIIGGIALGVRNGLKSHLGVDHGTGQKDFFKDLGKTLGAAVKQATDIKIEVKHDSHGGGHDDHGGGHDDHGGGGHH